MTCIDTYLLAARLKRPIPEQKKPPRPIGDHCPICSCDPCLCRKPKDGEME